MQQGSRTQPESPSTHGGVPPEAALPAVNEGQESCAPARRAAGKPARAAPQAVATQETREHPADGRAAQPQPPSSLWGGTAAPLMKSGGYAASPDACLDGEQLESSAEEVPQSLTTAAPTDGHLAPQAPPSITHPEIPQPTSSGSSPCAARLPVCQEFELQREELLADAEAAAAPSSTGVSAPPAAHPSRPASPAPPTGHVAGRLAGSLVPSRQVLPLAAVPPPASTTRGASLANSSRLAAANTMSPQGSAGGSRVSRVRPGGERRGASISARSSLLRPTVSFAAGVEATRSRQELHARASQPSAYQPKATQQRPFKLACDERAAHDHMCLGEEALLGTEERAVRKAAKERDELAVRLAEGRERCRRSLSAAPTGGTPTPRQQRQDAHAARIAAKAGAQLRQEEGRGLASPTWSSSSRIGALHGAAASTAATGPTLATQVRAARHADLRAVWAAREAEEAGQQEAKRPAQLAKPPILPGAHGASEQLGGQQGQAEDVGERETPAGTADGDDG